MTQQSGNWHPLLESVGDAVCIVNLDQCVLHCNSSMSSFLEKQTDEIVGHKCHDILKCDAHGKDDCLMRKVTRQGKRQERVYRSGEKYFRLAAEPIHDSAGKVSGAYHVVSEIGSPSSAAATGENVNRADDDMRKLLSLGMVSGAVAHDFNNILTGILGYSDLALCMLADADSNIRGHLVQIKASALQGAAMTNNMLSRSASEQFPREPLRAGAVINEVVMAMADQVPENVRLGRVIASRLPPLMANLTQFRQMLIHLVLNAIEAVGSSEGAVTLTAHAMDCSRDFLDGTMHGTCLPEGRYLCIEVADTGTGMSEETRARVPQLFFTTKPSGYGLGLTAIDRTVRQHGGTMKIITREGGGTKVMVFLPEYEFGE